MSFVELIARKRDGLELAADEIAEVVRAATSGMCRLTKVSRASDSGSLLR